MAKQLPLLFMVTGLLCLFGGLALLAIRFVNPEAAEEVLFATQVIPEPTQGVLLVEPLPAPDLISQDIPIMPVMGFIPPAAPDPEVPSTPTPSPIPPTITPEPSNTIPPPTQTVTNSTSDNEVALNDAATNTPIPFVTPTASPSHTPSITPSPTATIEPRAPAQIVIPAINLTASIQNVWLQQIVINDQVYSQWRVPEGRTVGWHDTSAMIGQLGNTVLNGHHNTNGRVFGDLVNVVIGDTIQLFADDNFQRDYVVVQTMLLEEDGLSAEERLQNARWLLPSADERVTLVTCWPPNGRTHRLVVVALPQDIVETMQNE